MYGARLAVRTKTWLSWSRNAWGIKIDMPKRHYKNEQHEKAMKAEVKKEDPQMLLERQDGNGLG